MASRGLANGAHANRGEGLGRLQGLRALLPRGEDQELHAAGGPGRAPVPKQ